MDLVGSIAHDRSEDFHIRGFHVPVLHLRQRRRHHIRLLERTGRTDHQVLQRGRLQSQPAQVSCARGMQQRPRCLNAPQTREADTCGWMSSSRSARDTLFRERVAARREPSPGRPDVTQQPLMVTWLRLVAFHGLLECLSCCAGERFAAVSAAVTRHFPCVHRCVRVTRAAGQRQLAAGRVRSQVWYLAQCWLQVLAPHYRLHHHYHVAALVWNPAGRHRLMTRYHLTNCCCHLHCCSTHSRWMTSCDLETFVHRLPNLDESRAEARLRSHHHHRRS